MGRSGLPPGALSTAIEIDRKLRQGKCQRFIFMTLHETVFHADSVDRQSDTIGIDRLSGNSHQAFEMDAIRPANRDKVTRDGAATWIDLHDAGWSLVVFFEQTICWKTTTAVPTAEFAGQGKSFASRIKRLSRPVQVTKRAVQDVMTARQRRGHRRTFDAVRQWRGRRGIPRDDPHCQANRHDQAG